MITKMDVMLFWEHARGFSWTEWCAFSPEDRGTIVAASREYFTEGAALIADDKPTNIESVTSERKDFGDVVADDGGLVGQVRTP